MSIISCYNYSGHGKQAKSSLFKDPCKEEPCPRKGNNAQQQATLYRWKNFCLENFKKYFGENTRLANIRYVDLETYRNHLKQELAKRKPSGPIPLSALGCLAFITYSQRPFNGN
jgi:hypothetical protein